MVKKKWLIKHQGCLLSVKLKTKSGAEYLKIVGYVVTKSFFLTQIRRYKFIMSMNTDKWILRSTNIKRLVSCLVNYRREYATEFRNCLLEEHLAMNAKQFKYIVWQSYQKKTISLI